MRRDGHTDNEPARRATDRLAIALEEAGFDVGQEVPELQDATNRQGLRVVRLGDVTPDVADRLANALTGGSHQPEEAKFNDR